MAALSQLNRLTYDLSIIFVSLPELSGFIEIVSNETRWNKDSHGNFYDLVSINPLNTEVIH